MSSTSNWGLISQSIVRKLSELVALGGLVKQVQAGTEEEIAAWAPKGFPAIAVVWKGSTIQKDVTLLAGRFALLERGRWEVASFLLHREDRRGGALLAGRPLLCRAGISGEALRLHAGRAGEQLLPPSHGWQGGNREVHGARRKRRDEAGSSRIGWTK